MATVLDYINNLKRIKSQIPSEVEKCIKDKEEDIVNLQQDQLYSGERADGSKIEPFYKPFTIQRKQERGQPTNRVTLFDHGNYYKGFKIKYFGNQSKIDIFNTDSKATDLSDKYGKNIVGLNPENQRYVNQLVFEWLEQFIKKEI